MVNGYDAFGKAIHHSKSEYLSLETMYRIEVALEGMIRAEEDTKSYLQREQETAYSELNDVVDLELREALDKVIRTIAITQCSHIDALDQIQKCIQRRRDYLCSAIEMSQNNPIKAKDDEIHEN